MPRKITKASKSPIASAPVESEADAAQRLFIQRKKELDEKTEALQKEAQELEQLRRTHIKKFVDRITFEQDELDAFLEVFGGMPGKNEIAKRLLECNIKHRGVFIARLVRMGLI